MSKKSPFDLQKYHRFRVNKGDFDLQNKEHIGNSSYGHVYLCTRKSDNFQVAVKMQNNDSNLMKKAFSREVEAFCECNHPVMIEFIGFDYDEENEVSYIFTKYLKNGSLYDYVRKNIQNNCDSTDKLIIAYGIVSFMEYFHSINRINRDLKHQNVLIDDNIQPKITDFGLSKKIIDNMNLMQSTHESSMIFMPSEFFDDDDYSYPVDVYSFAITIYYLITGVNPNVKGANIFQKIDSVRNGCRPIFPKGVPDYWVELITNCWHANPNKRPSFSQIKKILIDQPFINKSINIDKFKQYVASISTSEISPNTSSSLTTINSFSSIPQDLANFFEDPIIIKLKKAEASGDIEASVELGLIYFNGSDIIPQNIPEAKRYFQKAAAAIHPKGCYYYSKCLMLLSHSVIRNKQLFSNTPSCDAFLLSNSIAEISQNDFLVSSNNEFSVYSNSYANLISSFQFSTKERDIIHYLRMALTHGYSEAAYDLFLIDSLGTEKQLQYLQYAAEIGHKEAIKLYLRVLINKNERNQALKLIHKESEKGNVDMMCELGIRKFLGTDVEKNEEEGINLLTLAAESGNSRAEFFLARWVFIPRMLRKGNLNLDFVTTYFERAAKGGFMKSNFYHACLSNHYDLLFKSYKDYKNDPDGAAAYAQYLYEKGEFDTEKALQAFDFFAKECNSKLSMYFRANLLRKISTGLSSQISSSDENPFEIDSDYVRDISCHEQFESYKRASIKSHEEVALLCHCCYGEDFSPYPLQYYYCGECKQTVCESCALICHKLHRNLIQHESKSILTKCMCQNFVPCQSKKPMSQRKAFTPVVKRIQSSINKNIVNLKNPSFNLTNCYISPNNCSIRDDLNRNMNKKKVCTFEIAGIKKVYQKMFVCRTCSLVSDSLICIGCAETCHKDHEVVEFGYLEGVCTCGKGDISNHKKCSLCKQFSMDTHTCQKKKLRQTWYRCLTCDDDGGGFCERCSIKCHESHWTVSRGIREEECHCCSKSHS
ncbi:hypothetical protein TRFO_38990 [Tritrichomonas foetus]|uniref:Protein kinase domain-containing protein n=1 Tax=Tritrichomonas foetus TaxID=1144522 RepID=A0A1J4J825_9EUKA|nr:hypothetical protein TRFO_38990 [Tritrichomonas foetus]|eukprot:OHS94825.1 hypothetical protein TRFO_38990 [Tritrichomonas foetus]